MYKLLHDLLAKLLMLCSCLQPMVSDRTASTLRCRRKLPNDISVLQILFDRIQHYFMGIADTESS
jgi:hypothetical protein